MDFRIWFSSHVPKRFSFFVRLLLCCFSCKWIPHFSLSLYFYFDHSLFSLASCVCRVKWQCGKCKMKNTLIQTEFVFWRTSVYLQSAFNLNLNRLSSSLSLLFFFVPILFSVFAHFILYLFRRILNCTLSAHWPKPWANGLNCYLIWHLSETGCVNANYRWCAADWIQNMRCHRTKLRTLTNRWMARAHFTTSITRDKSLVPLLVPYSLSFAIRPENKSRNERETLSQNK